MFTGLVETTGIIKKLGKSHADILPAKPFRDLVYGESIAVNGCCLTLEKELSGGVLQFFTLAETLERTNLSGCRLVNMERALRVGDRLGGHFVSGHIDATAEILSFQVLPDGDTELTVELPTELECLMVEKGSVAIDGVSLTVVKLEKGLFSVHIIPVTMKETALGERAAKRGRVNLEMDIIGKYIRRQFELEPGKSSAPSGVTMEKLMENGFL